MANGKEKPVFMKEEAIETVSKYGVGTKDRLLGGRFMTCLSNKCLNNKMHLVQFIVPDYNDTENQDHP